MIADKTSDKERPNCIERFDYQKDVSPAGAQTRVESGFDHDEVAKLLYY